MEFCCCRSLTFSVVDAVADELLLLSSKADDDVVDGLLLDLNDLNLNIFFSDGF